LPDGRIVSGSSDKTIKIWDIKNKEVITLRGHTNWVEALSILPDGRIVSGSWDTTTKIWQLPK
jgi:WD40 repeat protein